MTYETKYILRFHVIHVEVPTTPNILQFHINMLKNFTNECFLREQRRESFGDPSRNCYENISRS